MHELGALSLAIKTVNQIAEKNRIKHVNFITLEIGKESSFVPEYFFKLYPIAIDGLPRLKKSELKIEIVDGNKLNIKEIGY